MQNLFFKEVLTNCYPNKEIYSKNMEAINESKIIMTFFFPPYKRAKREINYASVNQIVPAITEGLYVVAGHYVKNSTDKNVVFGYEKFPKKMWDAIFREFEKLVFSKKIPQKEFIEITFEVIKTEKVKNFIEFYFQFSGSVRGKAKCLIPV